MQSPLLLIAAIAAFVSGGLALNCATGHSYNKETQTCFKWTSSGEKLSWYDAQFVCHAEALTSYSNAFGRLAYIPSAAAATIFMGDFTKLNSWIGMRWRGEDDRTLLTSYRWFQLTGKSENPGSKEITVIPDTPSPPWVQPGTLINDNSGDGCIRVTKTRVWNDKACSNRNHYLCEFVAKP